MYEYRVIQIEGNRSPEKQLNIEAEEGWRLTHVVAGTVTIYFVMEREKKTSGS